ncbi:MAG: HlyD family efflux transporter periplasmic adaptor subunit [Acidobacteria bacterium]|nr:HlyD family efflux transporter periplasmic adaptor subunit [Acidobacteriota bacterium]
MDIQRPASVARARRNRRISWAAVGLIAIASVTVVLARLKPAAPTVDRAAVLTDTVKRGPMVRNVRGLGTLVPEEIRWIPAETAGRVERILIRPGALVKSDTIVLELSNPSEAQALAELEGQKRATEAELTTLRARIDNELVSQQAMVVSIDSEFRQATLQATADAELAKEGLKSSLENKLSAMKAEALNSRVEAERKRLAQMQGSVDAQLAVQQAAVERMRTQVVLKQSQVNALKVRAGIAGVLQLVPVEVGQQMAPGANLARVANPSRLKAELKIPETQAKDVQIGLIASIDTRNGLITGRVVRIDPAVVGGTVTVDVSLEGELPKGARPDLSVDGTIEIERLANVLFTGRPALGQENSTITLFRIGPDGVTAERVKVTLGLAAVNTVEIRGGLKEGDVVVLSDTSAWDTADRIRLK